MVYQLLVVSKLAFSRFLSFISRFFSSQKVQNEWLNGWILFDIEKWFVDLPRAWRLLFFPPEWARMNVLFKRSFINCGVVGSFRWIHTLLYYMTKAVSRVLVTTNGSTLYDFDELESSYSNISVTSNRTSNNLLGWKCWWRHVLSDKLFKQLFSPGLPH